MQKGLVIIGARGHGKVVRDIAENLKSYQKIFFLDDDDTLKESMGIPVMGKTSDVYKYIDYCDVFVAVGNAAVRKRLLGQLWDIGAEIPVLVHPQAVIGANVCLGAGTVVMGGVVINPDVMIGKGCIINTCSSVDHDCVIGDYAHVAIGAHLAGNVRVGGNTWIGAGATVNNNVIICENCIVGAGAVVVKSIQNAGTYIGVPAGELVKKDKTKILVRNHGGGKTSIR